MDTVAVFYDFGERVFPEATNVHAFTRGDVIHHGYSYGQWDVTLVIMLQQSSMNKILWLHNDNVSCYIMDDSEGATLHGITSVTDTCWGRRVEPAFFHCTTTLL
jgi:hypothetical protein